MTAAGQITDGQGNGQARGMFKAAMQGVHGVREPIHDESRCNSVARTSLLVKVLLVCRYCSEYIPRLRAQTSEINRRGNWRGIRKGGKKSGIRNQESGVRSQERNELASVF